MVDKKRLSAFFQTVGTLFSYNLGLPYYLAAYKDIKVTIGTRHLLLYVFGVGYTSKTKNLNITMTTFPTFVPFKFTLHYGSAVSQMLVRLSIFKKLISKFDIIHLNDRQYPYTKAAVDLKKETVLTLHWMPSKIDEAVISKLGVLVAPSENTARIVEETLGFRPKVIYHGADASLFNTKITREKAREHLGIPQKRKVILWNGRLDPVKDPDTLINAIPNVAKTIPESLFVVKARTDRGNSQKNMQRRIRNLGIKNNVRMIFGWDFITEMPYYYRAADVLVHTSLSEVCCLVIIEAMACGLPIILTDLPSVSGVAGNVGLRFEPRNSEDLAEKTIKLLYNEKLQKSLRDKGLRRVSTLGLTWKKAAERYRELYFSLM